MPPMHVKEPRRPGHTPESARLVRLISAAARLSALTNGQFKPPPASVTNRHAGPAVSPASPPQLSLLCSVNEAVNVLPCPTCA